MRAVTISRSLSVSFRFYRRAGSLASRFAPTAVERDRHQSTACHVGPCNEQLRCKHPLLHAIFCKGEN